MGLFDFLLPKQRPVQVSQTTQTKLGPEQEELFRLAFPSLRQWAQTPLRQFSGSGIAGFTPDELQAQGLYRDAAGGTLTDLARRAAATNQQLMDPDFMLGDNVHLQNMRKNISDVTTQDFLERVLPSVRTGNIQAGGMYSGGATKAGQAEGLATARTGEGLSRQLSELMFNAYSRGLSGMGEAINRNPSVMAQQLMPGDVLAAVGGQNRALEQAKLDEQIRNFYTGQMLPFMQSSELIRLLSAMPGASTTSTATGALPQANPLMQLFGLTAATLPFIS